MPTCAACSARTATAQRSGLAEDDALAAEYTAAHDVLYTAPCDIAVAEKLFAAYQRAVLAATSSRSKAPHPSNVLKEER